MILSNILIQSCFFVRILSIISLVHVFFFKLSFTVLSYGEPAVEYANESVEAMVFEELSKNVAKLCGAEFCPGITAANNPNLTPPDKSKVQMLMIIFLAMMIGASVLIATAVDGLKRYEMGRKGSGSELTGIRLLSVTVKQLMQVKQILLLPITMFIGAEQAFMAVDFTSVRSLILYVVSISRSFYTHSICGFFPV